MVAQSKGCHDIKEKGLSADEMYIQVYIPPCYMEAYVIVHRPHIKVGIIWRRRRCQSLRQSEYSLQCISYDRRDLPKTSVHYE